MAFFELGELAVKEPVAGFRGRAVHTEGMSVVHWKIDDGSEMPIHAHPHEQIVNLVEGSFELEVGDETRVLTPGSIVAIAPNVPHGGRALSDCRIIDAFHPVREDMR